MAMVDVVHWLPTGKLMTQVSRLGPKVQRPISTTPASDGQIFTDFGGREDAGTRVRQ